jgi:S-formylglutathione hydrolase FrmB
VRSLTLRLIAALAFVLVPLTPTAAHADGPPAVSFTDGHGLTVVPGSVHQLSPRLWSLSLRTNALPEVTNLRILMPTGYTPGQRYPVLWLFSGAGGGAADWTTSGGAEEATAGLPLIVVMPDTTLHGEFNGFCNDWVSGLRMWETYQIHQLLPWVDDTLPTIADRGHRAIEGVSGGGLCATSVAARHPDLFGSTTSLSGMTDIYDDPAMRLLTNTIIDEFAPQEGYGGDAIYGNVLTNGIGWAAYDPTTLASNLRSTRVHLYTGNGLPGEYDQLDPSSLTSFNGLVGAGTVFEAVPARQTQLFHERLDQLGISNEYVPYGAGSHSWPYFTRAFVWSLPAVMADVSRGGASPATFDYKSADDRYSVYGWDVKVDRKVREFSALLRASSTGFQLAGSGDASVITGPYYTPGRSYSVGIRRQGALTALASTVVADSMGRLHLSVGLGPSNAYQGETAAALLLSCTFTTTVTIAGT